MGQGGPDIVVCIVLENACWYGQIEIVRMLLDRVDNNLDLSINCLMNASGNGQTEVVQLLLEFEATRKANEEKATTLLQTAVLSTISECDGF
jgi:ankyrin repeat protein